MRPLFGRDLSGHLNVDRGVEVAPLAGLPAIDMPWPRNRKTCPFCVVGGTFSRSVRPPSAGTSTSPPSTASGTGSDTRV